MPLHHAMKVSTKSVGNSPHNLKLGIRCRFGDHFHSTAALSLGKETLYLRTESWVSCRAGLNMVVKRRVFASIRIPAPFRQSTSPSK